MPKLFPEKPAEQWTFGDIANMIKNGQDLLLILAIMAVFLLLLWSGVLYLTAYGNEEKAIKAKNTFFWAIAGMIIILLSKIIMYYVAYTMSGTAPDINNPPF